MIFTYNSPKIPFILLKTKLSPVTCHHMEKKQSHLNTLATNVCDIFTFLPKVQFLSPKVQFPLLTIWKFQLFFVTLHLY